MKDAVDDAWFVVHADAARWCGIPGHAYTVFEGGRSWRQYGMSIDVVSGAASARYHRELFVDESFLLLDGVADLIVEGEQHRVGAGDFVHCPAGTAHAFAGVGADPVTIFMFGARRDVRDGVPDVEYAVDERAIAQGVGVSEATHEAHVAYAGFPQYGTLPSPKAWHLDRSARPFDQRGRVLGNRRSAGDWFVAHVDDMAWVDNGVTARCYLDGDIPFEQYGININVLPPGAPNCRYHREHHFDESMLILDGEAILVAEGAERPVRAGDVVHCPAGTAHVLVGAGSGPCAILLVGTRDSSIEQSDAWGSYVADPRAARHGASVEQDTSSPAEAYADRPPFEPGAATWTFRRG